MNLLNRFGVVGVAIVSCAATGLAGENPASAPATTNQQQLLDEVRALRDEVKELRGQIKAQESPSPVDPSAAVGQTRDSLARDAARSPFSLDEVGFTAGYQKDKGFVVRSDNGDFLIHPWVYLQFRNTTNYRDNSKHGNTQSDTENGFELPRVKFTIDGNVFSRDLTYQFIWATNTTTGNLFLQDGWGRYHIPNTPFAVRGGQIRNPLDHEQLTFGALSMTPERSIVNNLLLNGDGIVKGASLEYGYDTPSSVRTALAVTGGDRNFDTTFSGFPTNPASWGVSGRAELKVFGDWNDYRQFTSLGDKSSLLVFGAGADYTEAGDTANFTHVADVQFNSPCGFSLYGAYLGRYTHNNGGAPGTNGALSGGGAVADTYDPTVRVMAGYLIDQRVEPFVRYEFLGFDRRELPTTAPHSTIQDITVGANYYFFKHRAKFTVAASWLPDGSPITNNGSDLLLNHGGSEFIFQAQFQLIL